MTAVCKLATLQIGFTTTVNFALMNVSLWTFISVEYGLVFSLPWSQPNYSVSLSGHAN